MDFQTPPLICDYMAALLPNNAGSILEPAAGKGNLSNACASKGIVTSPDDFFKMEERRFDWVVMNPPFTPMELGYDILFRCMEMSDNIIALMPWLTIINSEKRTSRLFIYGIVSVTHLPRRIFQGSRVQTCILEMRKGYKGRTSLLRYI